MATVSRTIFFTIPEKNDGKQDLFVSFVELWLKSYCKSDWSLTHQTTNLIKIDFKDSTEAMLFKLSH